MNLKPKFIVDSYMLQLHPESDLRQSYYYLGSQVLQIFKIKKQKRIFFEVLLEEFLKKDATRNPLLFGETLLFLYTLGIIDIKNYFIILILKKHDNPQATLF